MKYILCIYILNKKLIFFEIKESRILSFLLEHLYHRNSFKTQEDISKRFKNNSEPNLLREHLYFNKYEAFISLK